VQRFNQRQGFLVSAVIHLTLLMMVLSLKPINRKPGDLDASELEKRQVVFLPPGAVLRRLAPPPPAARARRAPIPTPPPRPPEARKKDRISVGPPSEIRRKGPMILRREDDLTKVPKGQPHLPPPAPAPAATPAPAVADNGGGTPETPGREGLRLPPGLVGPAPLPRGEDGSRERAGRIGSSVDKAVGNLMRREAQLGIPTGTGQNMAGFYFDPRGADFTLWIQHLKDDVYRNWILPQTALLGFRGHVDFEFTVERDGTMSSLRMLKSSGTDSLDKAARNSLTSSRCLPLPDDYGPPRITMQVTFYYNEAPQGS
jgi:periplasmic protein TonB